MTMTRTEESSAVAIPIGPTLFLAFQLGERVWKLGFTVGLGARPRVRQIPARVTTQVLEEIARAKARFRLPADAPVVSCYEAGREGFWLHRWLVAHGGLLHLLARHHQGDGHGWRVVRVPSVAEEDARHLHRTRETVQQDRNRLIDREGCRNSDLAPRS